MNGVIDKLLVITYLRGNIGVPGEAQAALYYWLISALLSPICRLVDL